MHIAETDIHKSLELLGDFRDSAEELVGDADRHFQHIVDTLALILYSQGILLISAAAAFIADDIDGRQEVHLDDLDSGTLAGLAAASRHVE